MAENSFSPNELPDEKVDKKASTDAGFSTPGDLGDMPVSPMDKRGSGQKDRMGYSSDAMGKLGNVAGAAGGEGNASDKAQEAGRQALKSAGGGGKLPGGDMGGANPLGGAGPVTKRDKEIEAQKSNTEKNADAALEAGANYLAPGTGIIIEKLGGTRGVLKKGGIAILAIVAILALPLLFIAYILNGGALSAISKIAIDPAARHFAEQAAVAYSHNNGFVQTAVTVSDKVLGEVDYHGSNTAIAAPATTVTPLPGSTLEKFTKIDWAKAKWQSLDNNTSCPYDLVTKEVVNKDGVVRSIPDYILEKTTGKHLSINDLSTNDTAAFCIQNEYPIFNLFMRQPETREINSLTNIHLNYAAPKDAKEVQGSTSDVQKYVYDKTLDRVTPTQSSGPDLGPYKKLLDEIDSQYANNINVYNTTVADPQKIHIDDAKRDLPADMQKMYTDMVKGTSPYEMQVQNYFNIPSTDTLTDPNNVTQINLVGTSIAEGICPFMFSFMDTGNNALLPDQGAKNAKAAIETRLGSAQRAVVKYLTLDDTRKADQLNTNENNVSLQQLDNWASSTGYQLNVYNEQRGVEMNPEATHNRAYNADQAIVNATDPTTQAKYQALQKILGACDVIGHRSTLLERGPEKGKPVTAERGIQANQDMINAYAELKKLILQESPGVFTSVNDFGLEQIMTGFIRTGSATADSGLEPGPQNFNRQIMGISQLSNFDSMRIGGVFLTDQETKNLALKTENTRRTIERQSGIAYRLFNTDNSRSLVSIIQANTTSPRSAMTAMVSLGKQLLNPLQNLANLNSGFNYFALGNHTTAYAADITSNQYFKIETASMPDTDLQLDVLANANIIENIKINGSESDKRKLAHYDECLKDPPPTKLYFTIQTLDKGDGSGHKINYFTYFPEKTQEVDQKGIPVNDNPDSAYNKYVDCKTLFLDARDFNNPAYQLPIRYRVYVYNNAQLDLLVKLSSNKSDESIYANPGGSTATTGGVSGGTNPGGFVLPVDKKDIIVSQCWGHGAAADGSGGHPGIDLAYTANKNPDIYAVADGTVDLVKTDAQSGGYGNMVYIKHSGSLYTLYAHNQEVKVKEGDQVKQGQVIAVGDSTGYSTGGHLHFEVRSGPYNTQSQHNPVFYIPEINTLSGQKCKTGVDEKGP